jgi:glutathione synthase/RimK-type ligase-like ATP-grasp enzyme
LVDIALITGTVDREADTWLDEGTADFAAFMAQVDDPLIAALEARGATVHRPVWHDPGVDWSGFDLALVRTAWDYVERRDEFVAWATRAATLTRLWNPPDVLRWNSHKSYLLELEERGAPVVPTAWLGQGDRVELGALLEQRDWPRAVVKPAIASGSRGMARVAVAGPVAAGAGIAGTSATAGIDGAGELDLEAGQRHLDDLLVSGDAMVQPFLERVADRGELSVVVVNGAVSHAVRKVPRTGEYRIQEGYGGRYAAEPVTPEVDALARWVVDATGAQLFISRVDLLEDDTGALQVAELEACEPDLYFRAVPEAAGPVADAILRRAAL